MATFGKAEKGKPWNVDIIAEPPNFDMHGYFGSVGLVKHSSRTDGASALSLCTQCATSDQLRYQMDTKTRVRSHSFKLFLTYC